ncbi:hypothetical protein ACFVGM_33815 [Kitasatospora purpeofusca]|uniref:hypothetical protein n=1 Tax=Kitasatospora purpeofusca TaxID=67352 RepID=UPI003677785D
MGCEIRKNRMLFQGRKTLVRERAEYLRFMDQGHGNKEAFRPTVSTSGPVVGGETAGRTPIGSGPPAPGMSSRCMSQDERIYIADRIRENASLRGIAAKLAAVRRRSATWSTIAAP